MVKPFEVKTFARSVWGYGFNTAISCNFTQTKDLTWVGSLKHF